MSPTSAADLLRAASLRVTRPRVAVLEAVAHHPHTDAGTVATTVREVLGKVSTQAVYDALHTLVDAGVLRRIEPAGSPARYETRVGDNHHHLVCRACGLIADVACPVGEAPCLAAPQSLGFLVEEAEVTHWGLCPDCRDDTRHDLDPSIEGRSHA